MVVIYLYRKAAKVFSPVALRSANVATFVLPVANRLTFCFIAINYNYPDNNFIV